MDAIINEIQDAIPKVTDEELKDTSKRRLTGEKPVMMTSGVKDRFSFFINDREMYRILISVATYKHGFPLDLMIPVIRTGA